MIIILILAKMNYRQNSDLNFKGVVQKIRYSDNKRTPTVTVNNEDYFLSTNIDFKHQIQIGDTLSKKKGEVVFKLTKKDSGKTIIFKD